MKRLIVLASIAALLILGVAGTGVVMSQSGNVWQVFFYPNTNWAGVPVFTQQVAALNYNWGAAAPGPNMPATNWTATATSSAYFYSGVYRYTVLADDEAVLWVDNVIYLDTRGRGQSGKTLSVDLPMTEGWHALRVDFRQYTGTSFLFVSWGFVKPGGGGGTIVPSPTPGVALAYPTPPASAPSVKTQFGDYTPCITNGWHQSKCFVSDGAWNSPNVGSIELEPRITIWGNCQPPDSDVTWTTNVNTNPPTTTGFRCSKTLAGWFPR